MIQNGLSVVRDKNVGNEPPNLAVQDRAAIQVEHAHELRVQPREDKNERVEPGHDADQAGNGESAETAFE